MTIPTEYILPGSIICPDLDDNTIERPCCPAVMIAPMLASGTATADTLVRVATKSSAKDLFGGFSPAAKMAELYFDQNPFGELNIVPYVPTGTPATGSVTVTGTATGAGTVFVRVNCEYITVDVITGDTADDVASAIAAQISGPVTGSAAGGVATLTSIFPGQESNQISMSASADIDGLTVTYAGMSGGAGVYNVQTAVDALGDCCCYDFIGVLGTDDATMDTMSREMRRRWGCECFTGGRFYNAFRGNFTETFAHAQGRMGKDPFASTVHVCPDECAADYEKTAAYIGRAHLIACNDPAQSWYNGELINIPSLNAGQCDNSCLNVQERNILAINGISTTIAGPNGNQSIEADVGRGALNAQGDVDLFLRYPQSAYQSTRFARLFAEWSERFQGIPMAATEVPGRRGVPVLTPNMFRAEYKAFLRENEGTLIENVEAAMELVQFDVDPSNPSRANVVAFFDPISAFRTFAVTLSPRINLQEFV